MADVIRQRVQPLPEPVAVPLSGGVDSLSVLLAARDVGKEAVALSFGLKGGESTDVREARRFARYVGVEWYRVELPTDPETVLADVRHLILDWGLRGKAEIECAWPMLYATRAAAGLACRSWASGSAADGHYGLSKKAMIHYSPNLETFDQFRRDYFADPDKAQVQTVARLARVWNIEAAAPYHSPEMLALTLGVPWEVLNKPRQKEPIRLAWQKEMLRLTPGKHTNLQLGDSGIADLFAGIADSQGLSPVALYNRIAAGGVQDSLL